MSLKSINPYNGNLIKTYKEHTLSQIEEKINLGHQAWLNYKETSFSSRTNLMLDLGKNLLVEKEKLAELMALEMGKPLKDGVAEIEKCAAVCEYYASNAENFLKDEIVKTDATKSLI
ncbi:MAG: aldehyde dehydrogenase family protein, partial [Pedobacter sp.]